MQTIVIRNVRGIQQGNNGIIVSLDQSIYGLFPVPLGAQVCLGLCNIVMRVILCFSHGQRRLIYESKI